MQVYCVSRHLLRDWLPTFKPEYALWKGMTEYTHDLQPKACEIEHEDYKTRIGLTEESPPPTNKRLSQLLEFNNREANPQLCRGFEHKFKDELSGNTRPALVCT